MHSYFHLLKYIEKMIKLAYFYKTVMQPNYYLQYHNADKLQSFPFGNPEFSTNVDSITLDNTVNYRSQFYTSKKQVENAIGQFCFLIVGKSDRIKKYFLWSFFKMEDFDKDENGLYHVHGTGYNFRKPILLNELEHFNEFKNFCGNFGIGFQNIDNHVFRETLLTFELKHTIYNSSLVERNSDDDFRLALLKLNEEMEKIKPEKRYALLKQILRKDGKIVKLLKSAANFRCQFPNCNSEILTKSGKNYVEVAHIEPVKMGGQSILGNLIVLCPNHHKEFDYGILTINEQNVDVLSGTLNGKYFSFLFHNVLYSRNNEGSHSLSKTNY